MSWIYLFLATVFEIGWPIGLKLAGMCSHKFLWLLFTVTAMSLSGLFLFFAQKHIPIGTAYAVWTGVGVASTFIVGVLYFNDTMSIMRLAGVLLIISGVVFLKLAH